MRSLKQQIERARRVSRPEPPPVLAPGLHVFEREADGRRVRFHLRVEPDGRALLVADASSAVRLSEAGGLIARRLLEGRHPADVRAEALDRFRGASPGAVDRDVERVAGVVESLALPGRAYPVLDLDDPGVGPAGARLLAPLEATLRVAGVTTLKPLLDRLWDAGVPHVVFRVGAGDRVDDVVRAVECAGDLGMITGVAGRALDVGGDADCARLAGAGVDHVDLAFASPRAAVHDALLGEGDHARAEAGFAALAGLDVCAVAETALTAETAVDFPAAAALLAERQVRAVSVFAVAAPDDAPGAGALPARGLPQVATLVEEVAESADLLLMWQPPVRRDPNLPLAEQVRRGPRCSGEVAIRVEPDGSVYPARGPWRPAGNLLADPWPAVWGGEVFRVYRERVEASTRCDVCPGLELCAAECPREPRGWS